jgi:RND family efflux transporter MFP subunit
MRALLPALLLLAACSGAEVAPAPHETPVPAGERLRLALVSVPDIAEVPATITTRDVAEARARIPGILTDLSVTEGDTVGAGQRIGTITDSRLTEEEAARAAAATAAEAEATRARADLDRIRFLHGEGVYAQARLDQAVAAANAATSLARAARAQTSAVAATAGQGAIIAPAAGRVLAADIPVGSAVSPGMVIATITAGPPVLRLDLPEGIGASLAPGASVFLSGSAQTGRITRIYPGIVAGRLVADAEIPGLTPRLVGQRVTATVTLGERRALAVPANAVASRYGLRFATLLAPDGKSASQVPVEARPLPDGRLEILSGLRPGDTLILGPGA